MATPERFLRLPAVEERTGFSRSTIWRYVKDGVFPRPISLGPNVTAWIESEIDAWMRQRIELARGQEVV